MSLLEQLTRNGDSLVLQTVIAMEYNSRLAFWEPKITPQKVDTLLRDVRLGKDAPEYYGSVNPQDIVTIAKDICKVIGVLNTTICPIVNSL